MKTQLDLINIIDLECCCWRGKPAGDIIEIGIATLNTKTFRTTKNESIIVRPIQDEMSDFCTELTTLTPEFVKKNGISFQEACQKLEIQFNSKNRVWASYGDFDRMHFTKLCNKYQIKYPFGRTHINIKNLLALLEGWDKEIGMAGAYNKIVGKQIIGVHHRGVDDARNIAYLFQLIFEIYNAGKVFRSTKD